MNAGMLLSWMVCGLIVGVIARLLVRGWHRFGLLTTMVLGIVGSFVGGFLYWLLMGASSEPFTLAGNAWHGWVVAIVGAVVVLWAYGIFYPRKWYQ
jgi:uncharacterized membrane protein YeaQ/YmgE (transglycosylase-associated protein family)